MNGFLNLLKPPGMSSAAAVSVIKRLTGEKTGHAGTLDPEASGVLPIMLGRAGRLLDFLPDEKKIYVAQIAFTGATDTQDAQGVFIEAGKGIPTEEQLLSVLPQFTGELDQVPPAYSALKQNGVPLYRAARRGEMIIKPPRRVLIEKIEYLGPGRDDSYIIRVFCSRGTYIRSLCHDIGQRLNRPAHMRFLLRTLSAGFSIENSVLIEDCTCAEAVERFLIRPEDAVGHLRRFDVPAALRKQCRNGVRVPVCCDCKDPMRVYLNDKFLGIAVNEAGMLTFRMICAGPNEDFGDLGE